MFLILESSNAGIASLDHAAAVVVFSTAGGTIGRDPRNECVLPDPHVSAQHAEVRAIGGKFFLRDNQSSNGVVINGVQLHPGELFPLNQGDVIFIDPFRIAVRISPTRPAGTANSMIGAQF
jgi:pSer/pThr/pTyr-binding forkhead associated (FHA) protein